MRESEPLETTRDVDVIEIPAGTKAVLPAGSHVLITQTLGGNYTVMTVDGYLYRVDGKDADALGKERAAVDPRLEKKDATGPVDRELIWDRLMRIGPDGLPQPWAAESYKWLDPTTIELKIRPDMKWHDGQPVTVEDVVFSFEAPATGDEAPMYKPFVEDITSIEAVDEHTVRMKLAKPNAAFLTSTLAKINLIPKHVWGPILADLVNKPENAEQYVEESRIGSGPFKYADWTLQQQVVLEANKDHWAAPKMDRWILRIIPNVEAALERSGGDRGAASRLLGIAPRSLRYLISKHRPTDKN